MTTKATVTFPDGTKGSRRTARPYKVVVAGYRAGARRPEYDIVKNRYEECADGLNIHRLFDAEFTDLFNRTRNDRGGWDRGYNEIDARRKQVGADHAGRCPLHCDGMGRVTIEVSRKPEATGWVPLTWHHSTVLAQKAMATERFGYIAEHFDKVAIFPVDEKD